MEEMREIVHKNLKTEQQHQKVWYDQSARDREMKPEEEVLVLLLVVASYWPSGKGHTVCCADWER